jgi:hypothetical protein
MHFLQSAGFIGGSLLAIGAPALAANECTQPSNPIETDRPDTTNSSIVVPVGSLQNENGINISRRDGADIFDGTNSRWRLGVAPCLEVLIDLPNYVGTLHGPSGFGDVTPAVKWQVSLIPGRFDLSITVGAAFAGRLNRDRRSSGCPALHAVSVVARPRPRWGHHQHGDELLYAVEPDRQIHQPADFRDRDGGHRTLLSLRRICRRLSGQWRQQSSVQFRRGYRITDTQQIDFHIAVGLNRDAPAYIFGIGYSLRLDGLFR